jgi:hypothetical protein
MLDMAQGSIYLYLNNNEGKTSQTNGENKMKKLAHLNKKAETIFNKIIDKVEINKGHIKIDSGYGFMPLSVNFLSDDRRMVAFRNYEMRNGDAMADPDVVFWIDDDGKIVPCSYRNDFVGVFHIYVEFCGRNKPESWDPRKQNDLKNFCNFWMLQIEEQQDL